jgi:D-glycerate 3-kinase
MLENALIRIIEQLTKGDRLSDLEREWLVHDLQNTAYSLSRLDLKISDLEIRSKLSRLIDERSLFLRLAYPEISQILIAHNIKLDPPSLIFPILWHYWLPLAQHLANQQSQIGRTFIQGLMGGQGTGKTTLGIVLEILLRHLGKTFLSISLDDLYKT